MLRVLVAFALLGFAAGAGHANACNTCKTACDTSKSTCASVAVQGVDCDAAFTQCNTLCNGACTGAVGGGSSDITTPNMPASVSGDDDDEDFDLPDLGALLAILQLAGSTSDSKDLATSVAAFNAELTKCDHDDHDHDHDHEESTACKAAQEAGEKVISTACNAADTGATASVTTGPLSITTMPSGGGDVDVSQACTLCKDTCTNAETVCKTNSNGNAQLEAACANTLTSCNTACNTVCGMSRLRRAANPVRRAGHADAASAHDHDDDDDDDEIFGADFEATCKASTTCQAVFTDGSGETAINNIASACQADMNKGCDEAKEKLQCYKGIVPKLNDLFSQIKKALPDADIPESMSNTNEIEANLTKLINDISAGCDIKSQYSLQAQIAAIKCGINEDSIKLPAPSEDFVKLQAAELDKKIEENDCNGAGSETDVCKQLLAEKEATDKVETTSAAKTIPSLVAVFVLGAVAQLF